MCTSEIVRECASVFVRDKETEREGVRENDISDLCRCFFPDYNLWKIIKFIRLNLFQVASNFLFLDEQHQLVFPSNVYSAKKGFLVGQSFFNKKRTQSLFW